MVGKEWTTLEQKTYLESQLPAYRTVAATGIKSKVHKFMVGLNETFLTRWPVVPQADMTQEDIGTATTKVKEQLSTWMRYRLGPRGRAVGRRRTGSLFQALKPGKQKRAVRAVEVYQKLYQDKVATEAAKRTEAALSALRDQEDGAAVESSDEEGARGKDSELTARRRLRMSIWRKTGMEMFVAETEEVKLEVAKRVKELNRSRTSDAGDEDEDRTPEQYQQ
ncbi:hypothetical protein B0H12DRAFT_1242769 [Mycena haematopus]|nr:hypothetical protein B0H12DRAFT_1242769 [Mycena haematopus]